MATLLGAHDAIVLRLRQAAVAAQMKHKEKEKVKVKQQQRRQGKKWENLLDAVRKKRNKKRVEMRLTLEMSLMTFKNSAVAAVELFQQPYFHFFFILLFYF